MILSQAKFVDPETGSEIRAMPQYLNAFESRDNESIQVSASITDGKIQVQQE